MKIPKASGIFGVGHILGLVFVLIGILLILRLMEYDLPILENIGNVLQYGAAIGSILGGLSMLFRRKTEKTIAHVPIQ